MIRRTATIHLFYCANSVTEAELQNLQTRLGADGLKTLSLPCSGRATIPYLLKAFEKGAEGVVLCTCPESQCKHLEGNLRASKRAKAVDGLLDEIGFGEGRVVVVTKEQGQSEKLIDTIQQLQAVCSVPARASETRVEGVPPSNRGQDARDTTPHGVTTNVLAGVRTGKPRENAA